MTTQNTESENNDINETVVPQLPVSETPIASTEAEVAMPANEQDTRADEMQSNSSEKPIEEEPVAYGCALRTWAWGKYDPRTRSFRRGDVIPRMAPTKDCKGKKY